VREGGDSGQSAVGCAGCRAVVPTASPYGAGVYRRLGFRSTARRTPTSGGPKPGLARCPP